MLDQPCIHHWQIEAPSGQGELNGHCYRCGADRAFPGVAATHHAVVGRRPRGSRRTVRPEHRGAPSVRESGSSATRSSGEQRGSLDPAA